MRFIIVILLLINLNYANSNHFVDDLAKRSEGLKAVAAIEQAKVGVAALRRNLSSRPLERKATEEERNKIIQSIVVTETAAMLIDGAYNFKFNRTAYVLPHGALTEREQVHYGWVFCLARTAQLLAENPVLEQADIVVLIGRDVRSCHIPDWMRGVFERTLRQIDWTEYVRPYLAVEAFALTETRREERVGDRKDRPHFEIVITEEDLKEAKECHTAKGIPFCEEAFLKPDTYTFDAYAIRPDGACMFYGCQGPYGYFGRSDFGEQIVDNMDSDPALEDLAKNSLAHDHMVWGGFSPREFAHTTVKEGLVGEKSLTEIVEEMDRPLDIPEKLTDAEKIKIHDSRIENIKSQIKRGLTIDIVKKIINKEAATPLFRTAFQGYVTYIDLIAYLNLLNIYVFSNTGEPNILTLCSHDSHIIYARGRTTFLLSAPGKDHVTRLVRRDDTMVSFWEYIRAKSHEERHGVKVNDGYKRAWM